MNGDGRGKLALESLLLLTRDPRLKLLSPNAGGSSDAPTGDCFC